MAATSPGRAPLMSATSPKLTIFRQNAGTFSSEEPLRAFLK
jgi:hypothetical protein